MSYFKNLWNDFWGIAYEVETSEPVEKYLTQDDVNSKDVTNFEQDVRIDVRKAHFHLVGTLAPWEVLMMYVIALEKRVKELESK